MSYLAQLSKTQYRWLIGTLIAASRMRGDSFLPTVARNKGIPPDGAVSYRRGNVYGCTLQWGVGYSATTPLLALFR